MDDDIEEEQVVFVDCTCNHPDYLHDWTECEVDGCDCEGHWEE